jgi:solute carrier family 25 S-adenosylmethionine transporter 26
VKSLLSKANPTLRGSSSPLIPQPFIHSIASATAELVSCFILTPAEVLKQNAQMIRQPAEASSSKSSAVFQPSVTVQALKQFQRPSQLWRGYTVLAARNLPFTAMQFPMFEYLKEKMKDYRKAKGTLYVQIPLLKCCLFMTTPEPGAVSGTASPSSLQEFTMLIR